MRILRWTFFRTRATASRPLCLVAQPKPTVAPGARWSTRAAPSVGHQASFSVSPHQGVAGNQLAEEQIRTQAEDRQNGSRSVEKDTEPGTFCAELWCPGMAASLQRPDPVG